jgi:cellulase/cellobiase CelA1
MTIWNEIKDGIATNADPILGGIIDQTIMTGEWFVIFNDDAIPAIEGIATRAEAFKAFDAAISDRFVLA